MQKIIRTIFLITLLLVVGIAVMPEKTLAATPTTSGAGVVTSYDPWVVWVNGSNLTNPLTVRMYDNNGNSWGNGTGVAYGSGNISFSLPSNMPPTGCNYTTSCNVSFDLVNNLGEVSARRTITLPQFSGYSCNRCSANFGCTNSVFKATDPGCTNVVPGTSPSYTTNVSCPRLNPPPAGGNNNNCPAATNTPTPTPQSCNRCSSNFGCTRATFQSNDGCVNPMSGTSPTYAKDTSCPVVNPVPAGGNNDNCAVSCNRCSSNFGCTRATFQSIDGCVNPMSGTTPTYAKDPTCPIVNPLPAGGNNDNCTAACTPPARDIGGVATSNPAAVTLNNSRLIMFVKGTDDAIYVTSSTDGNTFSSYQNLGGVGRSDPATKIEGSTLYVIVKGTDGQYYEKSSTNGTSFSSNWTVTTRSGATTSSSATFSGQTYTFSRGTTNNLCVANSQSASAPTFQVRKQTSDSGSSSVTITSGSRAYLSWSSTGASSCTITPNTNSFPSSASQTNISTGNLTSSKTYSITCIVSGVQTPSASVTVTVTNDTTPPESETQRSARFEQTGGIIFNGTGNIVTNQNTGKISERGWILNASAAGADNVIYKSPALNLSYGKLLANQDQTSDSFREITCGTNTNNCPPITTSGVYHVTNGNPQSNTVYTFDPQSIPAGRRVVVLVNGGVNITNTITTANGGIFILAAKNKITVNKTVGNNAYACNSQAQLQGIFSTQDNFEVDGSNDCTVGKDKMLIIDGNVITNADLIGNERFVNKRDLCEDNLEFPAVSIRQRPDFIINLPEFAKRQKLIFKELTP